MTPSPEIYPRSPSQAPPTATIGPQRSSPSSPNHADQLYPRNPWKWPNAETTRGQSAEATTTSEQGAQAPRSSCVSARRRDAAMLWPALRILLGPRIPPWRERRFSRVREMSSSPMGQSRLSWLRIKPRPRPDAWIIFLYSQCRGPNGGPHAPKAWLAGSYTSPGRCMGHFAERPPEPVGGVTTVRSHT